MNFRFAAVFVLITVWPAAAPATADAEVIRVPGDAATLSAALNQVGEGDVIELAGGTHVPPAGGWTISNLTKSFTIRGEAGQIVALDGGSSSPILKILNANPGHTIVFENLTFRNGSSSTNGTAGGVTLSGSSATFVDCVFDSNEAVPTNSGGGGVALFSGSEGFFFGCRWTSNRARNEGGGLKVGGGSRAFVHEGEFLANRTNIPNHRSSAAGAGIHVANSEIWISNTRFEANQGSCIGGGLYALGGWDEPTTEVTIVNSTFVDNFMAPLLTCGEVGAAIHAEDNVRVVVHHSRFLTNTARLGGAINMERSTLEVYDSVFRGNLATGNNASGGTIAAKSVDKASDTVNRPVAQVTLRDTLVQGRFDGVGPTANIGGCVWMLGDTNRSYGRNGVAPMGNPTTNRARLDVQRTALVDCDAESSANAGTGVGGAMFLNHVDLELHDSLVMDSDAFGPSGAKGLGGGIRALNESSLTISGTTFADNTGQVQSGALHVTGSAIDVDACQFFENEIPSGPANLGHVITTAPAANVFGSFDFDMTGSVRNSTFSRNGVLPIREVDFAAGPINAVVWTNNRFHPGGTVYRHEPAGDFTAAGLNGLVVTRDPGQPSTDKGSGNLALGSAPELGALLAVPPVRLPTNAAGDPAPPTQAFLAWAGSGGSITLNGSSRSGPTGLQAGGAGNHTLVVGSSSFVDQVTNGPTPAATFGANPVFISGGGSSDLVWTTDAGTFLDVAIDREVEIALPAGWGSESVAPPATRTYDLYVLTEEGGVHRRTTVFVDEVPGLIFTDGFESGDTSAWSSTIGG